MKKVFDTNGSPNWCPGCGNYSIWNALKMALSELDFKPEEVVITSGIGCSSKISQWVRTYAFNGIHGRPIPLAIGIRLSNPQLKVIAHAGDGDGYAEGTNHFIHLMRSGINITYIVHNNQVYALTKGQASPTSDEGFITKTTPSGVVEKAINPLMLALSAGASFVARGFAGDVNGLKELMKKAIRHNGPALLDVLQPCVTYNHKNTYEWYKKRVYYLKQPLKTRAEALRKAMEWGERIPIGVFYARKEKTFEERIGIKKPLVHQDLLRINIKPLLEELKS